MKNLINEYKPLTNQKMVRIFQSLHDVNEQIRVLQATKKELESQYKPSIEKAAEDELYFILPSGQKLNIKKSERKGGWNAKRLEELMAATEVDEDEYRNKPSTIYTLRFEANDGKL